jgi:hypothetical protein
MNAVDRHVNLQSCVEEFFGLAGLAPETVAIAEAFAEFVLSKRAQHERAEVDQLLFQSAIELDIDAQPIGEKLTGATLLQKVMLQRSVTTEPSVAGDVLCALRTIDAYWDDADGLDWELLLADMEALA